MKRDLQRSLTKPSNRHVPLFPLPHFAVYFLDVLLIAISRSLFSIFFKCLFFASHCKVERIPYFFPLVSDAPAPPEGPLKVTEIRGDGVSLKWRPPKEDGGAKLEGWPHFFFKFQPFVPPHQ